MTGKIEKENLSIWEIKTPENPTVGENVR